MFRILLTTVALLASTTLLAANVNPEITFTKLENETPVKMSELYSKKPYTLFTIWASWCVTCKEELKLLQKYQASNDTKLNIFAVSIDSKLRKSKKFKRRYKIELPIVWDPEKTFLNSMGFTGVPALALVDNDGNVIEQFKSFDKKTTIETITKRIK